MKDILNNIIETIKNNKKKIGKIVAIIAAVAIIASGIGAGVIYSNAKSNINYNEKQLEAIAVKKIPGEVVNVKKELEFEDATFEYTFQIKDKENMLQEITLSSKSGAITDIEIDEYDSYKKDNEHHKD